MKCFLSSLFSLLGLLGCNAFEDLSVDEFEKMLLEDPTVQLVDVRTPQEFEEGHLNGAVNINWNSPDFLENAKRLLDPGRPVLIYCRSGRRSASAAASLSAASFKTYNLLGGYMAWSNAGKRVIYP